MNLRQCSFVFAGLFFLGATALSATYPEKPVRFIVAFPAGGNADLISRVVAQKLSESFKHAFVVDNRGGAGGVIGEELAAKSPPDGYTMVLVSLAHTVNPNLNKPTTYDPVNDFVPVSLVASVPNVLLVHNSVPAKTVPEFIALAKSKPGQLNYVASLGTSLHISGELFKAMAGVDLVAITYKSGAGAAPDLEAGRVQVSFSVISTAISTLKSGRVRALAVTSAKRSMILPDLPAIAEFVPGYELTGWQGILMPRGTPPAIVNAISREIALVMRNPEVQARMVSFGADPIGSTPEQFGAFRKAEFPRIAKLMSQTGMKAH